MREPFHSVITSGISRSPVAAWRSQANCLSANPSRFFAEGLDENQQRRPIKASVYARETINEYCVPCPVRKECLAEGLRERYGIWGGTTPKERRALRKEAKEGSPPNNGLTILLIRS